MATTGSSSSSNRKLQLGLLLFIGVQGVASGIAWEMPVMTVAAAGLLAALAVQQGLPALLYACARRKAAAMRNAQGQRMPGPAPAFPDGTTSLWSNTSMIQVFEALARTYGGVFAVWFGHRPCVVVSAPDVVDRLLVAESAEFLKGPDYDIARILTGDGLLTSNGQVWSAMRKAARPVFAASSMKAMSAQLETYMANQLQALQAQAAGSRSVVIDLYEHAMHAFVALTCSFFYSQELPAPIVEAVSRDMNECVQEMKDRMDAYHVPIQCVDAWIAERQQIPVDERPNDLLTAYMSTGYPTSQVRDEVLTVMLVGHDASSACIAWTAALLGAHPAEQSKLIEEVRNASTEDAGRLPYLNAVVKESLRLYPPAAAFGRFTTHDHDIGGYQVPAKTFVFVVPYITQRDPAIWGPTAERFDPVRFMSAGDARPGNVYYPFGIGPRNCVGQAAAIAEMKLYLLMLLQRFRIRLTDTRPPVPDMAGLVIRPEHGMLVELIKHEQ